MSKLQVLKDVLGSYHVSGAEHLFSCPYCKHHKRKMSINLLIGKWKCWICDKAGNNPISLIRKFGSTSALREWQKYDDRTDLSSAADELENLFITEHEEEEIKIDLPKEYQSLAKKECPVSGIAAKSYLNKRRITLSDALYWKIGYCTRGEYEGRIIIPSFNKDGYPNYFIARTYEGHWKKYLNPTGTPKSKIIFNELYLDFNKPLTIVEGVFDAIVAGQNSVPLLGSTLRKNHKLFQEIAKNDSIVYLALDPDAHKKQTDIVKLFLQYGIKTYIIDTSGFADVGEMTRGQFNKRKRAAKVANDFYLLYESLSFGV